MKHWILGAALFVATGVAQAENYRIVQSPSQKLDVWIDNIKGNTAQSWCANEVRYASSPTVTRTLRYWITSCHASAR